MIALDSEPVLRRRVAVLSAVAGFTALGVWLCRRRGSARTSREVQFGKHCRCTFGPDGSGAMLQQALDSGPLLVAEDFVGLRQRLARDGYLFIRGALPSPDVEAARLKVLGHFQSRGILDPTQPVEAAILRTGCSMGGLPFLEGQNAVTHSPEVLRVFEGDAVTALFRGLHDAEVRTFDYKWLRAVSKGAFTGAHNDAVYMSRGSPQLLTCWIPFGVNPIEMGAIAVCEKSHNSEGFRRLRETYGALDHEKDKLDGTGWFTEDPQEIVDLFGGQWRSADYLPGDVMVFTMQTTHMSTTNVTNKARISADVRWQSSAEPIDPRYTGETMKVWMQEMSVAGAWRASKDDVLAANSTGEDAPVSESPPPEAKTDDAIHKKRMSQQLKKQELHRTIVAMREDWGFPVPIGVELK